MPEPTTSPTPPAAGPQTHAALVDGLPPPPTPPACMPQSPWDMMQLTQDDLRAMRRFDDDCRAYCHQVEVLVVKQTTKMLLEIIQQLEGAQPDIETFKANVTAISIRSPDDACEPCTRYYWKGQPILDTRMQWRTSDEHPSPSMHIKVLV